MAVHEGPPHPVSRDDGSATVSEVRDVYENMLWAFEPILESVFPGAP